MNNLNTEPAIGMNDILETNELNTKSSTDLNTDLSTVDNKTTNEIPNDNSSYKSVYDIPVKTLDGDEKELDKKPIKSKTKTPLTQKSTKKTYKSVYDINPRDFDRTGSSYMISQTGGYTSATYDKIQSQTPGIVDLVNNNIIETYKTLNPEPVAIQETPQALLFDEQISLIDKLTNDLNDSIKQGITNFTPLGTLDTPMDRLNINEKGTTKVDSIIKNAIDNPTIGNKIRARIAQQGNEIANKGGVSALQNTIFKEINDIKAEYEKQVRLLDIEYKSKQISKDTDIYRKDKQKLLNDYSIKVNKIYAEVPELKELQQHGFSTKIANKLGIQNDRLAVIQKRQQIRDLNIYKKQVQQEQYKYEHKNDSYVDNIVENTLNLFKRMGENITSFESMPVNYEFESLSFVLGTIADAGKTNLESLLYENSKIARNNPNASWYYKEIAGVMDFAFNIPLGFIRNVSNLNQDINPFSYLQNNEYDILNGESSYVGTRVFDKYAEQRGRYTPNETNWFESYVFAPALQTAESVVLFGLEAYLLGGVLGKVTAGIISKVPQLAKLPQVATALTTGYLEGQQIGDETAKMIFQDAYYNQGLSLSESKRKAEYGANIAKITNAVLIASSDFIQLGALFKGANKVGLRKLYMEAVEAAVAKGVPRELAKKQVIQSLMQSPITRQAIYKTTYEGLKSAGGEYYEETIANEFAKYLGVSAADNNELLNLSTWGNAIKETAHGFVELETQLGGIWGAIGGGSTHLMFNHAMSHNININQIDPNGDLLYIQPDGSISTNVTNKVATKTEIVKGWQLEQALQRQTVGQYLEALTNDNYFQIQAYSQLQEEIEKKNKGEAYSQDKIDYLRRNIFDIYNYRQSTNGNHNDLINQMNETLQMSQQDAIDKGLAENDTDTKWKTALQENIDNLTILGTKIDMFREKYSIDKEPNSKQSSLYQAEVYKAIQENELSKLEKQLNIHKNEYEDYIKRNNITNKQRVLVDTFSQIQELTKQIQDLQESLNTHNLTNATISELFDITQSKKELLKNIKIAITDKSQQLKQLNTQFEELNKSNIEQDTKLKQLQDDYSKAIKEFNDSLAKVQSYSKEHNELVLSHKQNEININKLKVNIHRLLTENNEEDLILKQEQLKILENKQKDLTKKIKENKKIYDTEHTSLKSKENNIKTLRESIDKRKTDLQKKQTRLQNKITKFYQEHNNYTNALKLINKVKNNIEISKNSIAAMNKNNLNFIHTMRISSLIQKQAEYTNRISHRYVGIQNAVLNNNYEDVLYNKINHTNLNQYLDWQVFTKLDEAGKQTVLKLIEEVKTLNNATNLNKIIDDKGVAHIIAKRKAIMDILNHTNTTIRKVEKSIQNKEPKATTPEEHSLINQLKEFLQAQQAYRDTYTHVLNTIDTILQQHSDEITKIEEQEKYENGTEIKPTNESVLKYINTILDTIVINTKNNKTTIENIPNKNGFLALFNAISLINKNQIDQNILLKLKSLESILNRATDPFFDSVKLNSVIQYLTTNTTTDIELTLEELQNENIEDELILRGSLDGVLEGLDILEALMKNTLNDIQNIMRLYETTNIPEQKLEYLNQVLTILGKMKYIHDQLRNMNFMGNETLNKLESIGITNKEDIADITQKIFIVNTPYRVISKDIPQFEEKIKELQQQINNSNLDSELIETQEELETINKEIIKNIFKPISDYFQIEIPKDDDIIPFKTEVLTTELIETLENLNETLNSINYSNMDWVQKIYDIVNDLNKGIYNTQNININDEQKQEIVKFIINKILARNMNNEILDMIIFQQQELQPQSTVDSVTKKLPIVSYIIDAANRNEIIRYENDTTNSKRLILLVQSLRQLMNTETNTITFEKQIIEYGNDETFGGYLNNSKVNRKYTTFVIPNTNFSLPSLEHTKIVLKLLQNDNIDEVLRKLSRLKNNRKHLSNEEFINQYNDIVSDEIKKDFEAHFIGTPNDINSYINKITSSINSYTKRLDRYNNIKEHIPDCEAIIKLYETNEKTLTLEFENNIELTVIPVFDMSNKKHFAANTPSLVTIEKFNNDVNDEHNLSNHFELAIPQTATQTTNQYYIGNKLIELNKEHRGLILNPISENAVFDPNKPFGGNVTLQLESTKFTNELIDEIYNNLVKLPKAFENDINDLIQNISLYFTNTTSGNKFFEHNSILKYINIGLQSNNKNIELRIQYDKSSITIIYSEEKKLQRSTDESINSSLEINNNVITVEGQTIKTKLVEGVMTYTLTKNNKKTTINKQEAINILKTKPTYVQNVKTSINKETFATILSNNYIAFNYKQLRDMQQQGVNVLDKIGKHLKIRQGVIKEQGKVVETLIPKVLVNDKIQELFIFIPEIKQKEIEKTTALSSPIGETKKPTFKTISKRSINNKMRNARVIYLHDEIALDDNYLIHTGDALQLEELRVQAIKENKIVVTKMKDKADIVFVSDKSILNTEFSGYNNIYTGDVNAVLKARFTPKVEQLELFNDSSNEQISSNDNEPIQKDTQKNTSELLNQNNQQEKEPLSKEINVIINQFDMELKDMSKEDLELMFEDHNVSLENRIQIEALWNEINTELNNEDEILKQNAILDTEIVSVLEQFANALTNRFNIPVQLITEAQAKQISKAYNGEPAFYDTTNAMAYLVKGKANKTSAIHEIFTHPFLLQIEKTNPELYNNLLQEAKNNKKVVEHVNQRYSLSNVLNKSNKLPILFQRFNINDYNKVLSIWEENKGKHYAFSENTAIEQYEHLRKIFGDNVQPPYNTNRQTRNGDDIYVIYVNKPQLKTFNDYYTEWWNNLSEDQKRSELALLENKDETENIVYQEGENTNVSQKVLDHEYIARAIDLYTQKELDEQKDKSLIERIKEFFNNISNTLKQLLNITNTKDILPTTTLEELTKMVLYGENKINLNPANANIQYTLKAVDILLSDKARQVFEKGNKNNWNIDKILQELAIPKEQKQLILDLGITDREQLVVELASKYGYTVEINTAKQVTQGIANSNRFQKGGVLYEKFGEEYTKYTSDGKVITISEKEYKAALNSTQPDTQQHSSLTVNEDFYKNNPDWEYKIQQIVTPNITPTIQKHNFGSKEDNNKIGWFRAWYNKKTGEVHVLEIQSDLFQKGRDKKELITEKYEGVEYVTNDELIKKLDSEVNPMYSSKDSQADPIYIENIAYSFNTKGWYSKKYSDVSKENQFLQLLNKDNNWVTFFIKAIIQDSAKKGYEKVLFPKGETAAKIEGHETIADEIENINEQIEQQRFDIDKFKQNRFKNPDSQGNYWGYKNGDGKAFKTLEEAESYTKNQLTILEEKKQEYKSQGIEKLKPIEAFYEIKVGNILEKQFGKDNVKTITDEFGNQWREIDLNINVINKVTNIQLQSTIPIKEGVSELFESNPELANAVYEALGFIGNISNEQKQEAQQLYSQYLDTIFPNSKVKDIVYHTTQALFDNFDDNKITRKGHFFSFAYDDYRIPDDVAHRKFQKEELENQRTIAAVLNIENSNIDYLDINGGIQSVFVNTSNQIHILGSKQDIQGFKNFVQSKQFQKLTAEEKAKTIEQVTKEHRSITALKDLAAKLAHRIGGKVKFENNPNADWKGYNQEMASVLNEAYMTPDTPFHEILAHPIIRAIKNKHTIKNVETYDGLPFGGQEISISNELTPLYKSLLKELETGRGKEIFEQVKRDYNFKLKIPNKYQTDSLDYYIDGTKYYKYYPGEGEVEITKHEYEKNIPGNIKYTLEEQQEEAIVTLLGELAAGKLEEKENATLKKKLLEFWKQISDFVKSLLRQDSIKIDELPITTTLNDLAEIMGYGNNKIILPNYKVEYSTPLGNKYDTLEEVNNEIKGLADANVEVDLSGIKVPKNLKDIPNEFTIILPLGDYIVKNENGVWNKYEYDKNIIGRLVDKNLTFEEVKKEYLGSSSSLIHFIEKNKEYEQSREIIEEWKKENNIQYDPEEVYSRGQEFYHIHNAYSRNNVDTELWIKNLLETIQDKAKIGAKVELSFATAPKGEVGKGLQHHNKETKQTVYITSYPKSEDIGFVSEIDNHTSSFTDLTVDMIKFFTNQKNERVGIALTKSVPLYKIYTIQPNLATTVDNVAHHNEIVIGLTPYNFRINYEEDVPYHLKKLIDNFNKILDDKYGKLEKPKISTNAKKLNHVSKIEDIPVNEFSYSTYDDIFYYRKESDGKWYGSFTKEEYDKGNRTKTPAQEQAVINNYNLSVGNKTTGKQPTQTKENTTSIESVETHFGRDRNSAELLTNELKKEIDTLKSLEKLAINKPDDWSINNAIKKKKNRINELNETIDKLGGKKEYTSQAEINLKVAALKEVARKYPRSLITSKVVPINPNIFDNSEIQYSKLSQSSSMNEIIKPEKDLQGIQSQKETIEQRYEETTRNASIETKVLKFIPSKLSISDKNKCN